MTDFARRTPIAALVAVALLGLAPASAHAKDQALVDGAGDVWVRGISNPETPVLAEDPPANADLRRVVVRHLANRVLVRAKFADLTQRGEGHSLVVTLRTDKRLKRTATLLTKAGNRQGTAELWRPVGARGTAAVSCTLGRRVDYGKNEIVLRIPRGCLKSPSWVKAQVSAAWSDKGAANAYSDNPHNDQAQPTGWTRRLGRG